MIQQHLILKAITEGKDDRLLVVSGADLKSFAQYLITATRQQLKDDDYLLNASDVEKKLGCCRSQINKWIKQKVLTPIYVGDSPKLKFSNDEVNKLIKVQQGK